MPTPLPIMASPNCGAEDGILKNDAPTPIRKNPELDL